jgi:hypothetical protein
MEHTLQNFRKEPLLILNFFLFIILSIWWICLDYFLVDPNTIDKQIYAASYQILALFGSIVGFWMSRRWGGYKSLLGKALICFSLGLLLQSFGQSVYSYYIFFKKIEIPYPSVGDVGFFGSVISYIIGSIYLSKVAGFHFSWKSTKNKILSIAILLIMLILSYFFFLRGYEFDSLQKLKTFLDFGYPLGQAFYVSIAVLTLIISKNVLGGVMKKPVLFLICALIIQYLSDFMFLYQANAGTWSAGGVNDYLYCISYFSMSIALIHMGGMFAKIKNSK